jgi:hypothetical protein
MEPQSIGHTGDRHCSARETNALDAAGTTKPRSGGYLQRRHEEARASQPIQRRGVGASRRTRPAAGPGQGAGPDTIRGGPKP